MNPFKLLKRLKFHGNMPLLLLSKAICVYTGNQGLRQEGTQENRCLKELPNPELFMQEKKSYQILMVAENDVEVKKLERLLATLSLADFQFTQMSPAELSVARYGDRNFDIGIVDLGHGDSPELNIIDYLHRKMPYLPMIILNEQEDVDYSLLALRKGAQDYLVKSQLDAERLIRSLHYAMERMQQTEKLANRISYEPLTGLANRLLLNDRLEQAIKRAERYSTGVAVLYIDIDKFRVIDEKLGRKRANDYLKKTANRIRQCLRNSDTVARVGSDEFIVLLEAMSHTHGAMSVSKKILQSFNRGINIDGKNIKSSCSIGIALYPQCGEEINDLICKADITRCRAAREGGNRYCIYTEIRSESRYRYHNCNYGPVFHCFYDLMDLAFSWVVAFRLTAWS